MSRSRPGVLASLLAVVLLLSSSATATAHVSRAYAIVGVEVWATPTVGTFVGEAVGSGGDLAVWRASIEHTVQTQPFGLITGGRAIVRTSDLTKVTGRFTRGRLVLIDDGGEGCGDLTHRVRGRLRGVTRSDANAVGTGRFRAILVHYRASILGHCIAYSATAQGTITFEF
jgi:hypothetical protein